MTQEHGTLDADIASRPATGPQQTLLGGVHLAPVGERAGLSQPRHGLEKGDTGSARPVPGDAAQGFISAVDVSRLAIA
jgi:hypothetical protein